MNKWAVVVCLMLTGCTLISTKYVKSAPGDFKPRRGGDVAIYYSQDKVPFKYKEIGRVYVSRTNYWADRDKGAQIEKLRNKAAANGAEAIIVMDRTRYEAAAAGAGNAIGAQAGDVHDVSAIAVVKE